MAILSNINGKFAVDSTGAIQLSGSAGTANYVLVSGGAAAAPTWVAASTVIGGPYLPLSGGILTGNLSLTDASNPSLTVTTGATVLGGTLTVNGTSATFNPDADSSAVIKNAGTNAIALFAASGDTLYLGSNDTTGVYFDKANNDATFIGDVEIGGAPSITPNTNFDNLVITDAAHSGITILSGTSSDGAIYFGDSAFNGAGQIKYLHASDSMTFTTGNNNITLSLDNFYDATFSRNVTVIGNGTFSGTSGVTVNSTSHAYLTANSSATTTASWVYHKQGGTGRWLAGVEGSETKWQLYASGTQFSVDTSGNGTFAGSITTQSGISSIYNRLKITNNTDQLNIGQWDGANHRIEGDAGLPIFITSYEGNINLGISGGTTLNVASTGATVTGTLATGATTITSATSMLLTLNPTAGSYGGILFQYGGVTKGASIYNSGLMVYGGEAGIATRIQAGGGYGLHIDYTNQNVHIGGTSDASYKLQVTGTTYTSGNAVFAGDIILTPGNSNKIILTPDTTSHYITASGYWIDVIGNQYEVFRVFGGSGGTTEFMRIEGSGYTKLTDDGDTTWQGYDFHAITQSAASEPTVMIYNDNAGGNNYGINVIHRSTGSSTTGRFFLGATNNGSTEKIKIYTNGSIENATNSYGQLSDLKLKENVVDATAKLDDIMKVKIKNFNYIGEDLKQIGVIAQELEEVFPGLIYETPDTEIVNKKEVPTGSVTKGVKYSVFVPMLIKSIQELEARVKELENK